MNVLRSSPTFLVAFFSALIAATFASLLHGCDPMPGDADYKPERSDHMTREWRDYPLARYHDDAARVTCWTYRDTGISCTPDALIAGDAGEPSRNLSGGTRNPLH